MEYLTTYGWAILILAIVLVAFFSLGVFNPYTFSPKASPGSCQILRPNGPGSNIFVSAVGPTCTTNEIPQYVGVFPHRSAQINIGSFNFPLTGPRSAFAWIYYQGEATNSTAMYYSIVSYGKNGAPAGVLSDLAISVIPSGANVGFGGWGDDFYSINIAPNSSWMFVGYSYSGGSSNTVEIYMNNKNTTTNLPFALSTVLGSAEIGERGGPSGNQFSGMISNVQIYNTSLSSSQVSALYSEGIGGMPVDIQNLVGWWPLNGNSKDYSGNGNNGVPTDVVFTSSWENGYSSP